MLIHFTPVTNFLVFCSPKLQDYLAQYQGGFACRLDQTRYAHRVMILNTYSEYSEGACLPTSEENLEFF